jgi:hypothetical protein
VVRAVDHEVQHESEQCLLFIHDLAELFLPRCSLPPAASAPPRPPISYLPSRLSLPYKIDSNPSVLQKKGEIRLHN